MEKTAEDWKAGPYQMMSMMSNVSLKCLHMFAVFDRSCIKIMLWTFVAYNHLLVPTLFGLPVARIQWVMLQVPKVQRCILEVVTL